MRTAVILGALCACASLAKGVAHAAVIDDGAVKHAMQGEMARSMKELRLPGSDPAYFMRYRMADTHAFSMAASHGQMTFEHEDRGSRRLYVESRVGSPNEDNSGEHTTFSMENWSLLFMRGSLTATIDDRYDVLRRDLWGASDAAYKDALAGLANKRAKKATHTESPDQPPDFSSTPAIQASNVHAPPFSEPDRAKVRALTILLSQIFKAYPTLRVNTVNSSGKVVRRRILTSEQTWTDETFTTLDISVNAEALASDGQRLEAYRHFTADTVAHLPAEDVMEAEVRSLAERLKVMQNAKRVDPGRATILFEGRAAAQIAKLTFGQPLEGSYDRSIPWDMRMSTGLAEQLGQTVAPAWLTVTDDPKALGPGGRSLFGTYESDDEGVKGEKLMLIDHGKLRTLYMSRAPRKTLLQSNGHGRGTDAIHSSLSNLFVTSSSGLDRDHLLALAAKQNTPVYVIREIGGSMRVNGIALSIPVRDALRYDHGKEEPVRGMLLPNFLPTKINKDLLAAGTTAVTDEEAWSATSVTSPPLLFGDVTVAGSEGKNQTPPLYPSPLATP